jgi:hypothetical protein
MIILPGKTTWIICFSYLYHLMQEYYTHYMQIFHQEKQIKSNFDAYLNDKILQYE